MFHGEMPTARLKRELSDGGPRETRSRMSHDCLTPDFRVRRTHYQTAGKATAGSGDTRPDPAMLTVHLPKALSTFSPAFSTGPFGSTASFTLSTALSMLSPALSAGPFSLQETDATNGSTQNKADSNDFMIRICSIGNRGAGLFAISWESCIPPRDCHPFIRESQRRPVS